MMAVNGVYPWIFAEAAGVDNVGYPQDVASQS